MRQWVYNSVRACVFGVGGNQSPFSNAESALAFGDFQSKKEMREKAVAMEKQLPHSRKIDLQQTIHLDLLVYGF